MQCLPYRMPFWAAVLLSLVLVPGALSAQEEQTPVEAPPEPALEVSVQDGLFTVAARDVPLEEVLAELAALIGIDVDVDPELLQTRVTVEKNNVPFEAMMKALAGSHALVYERSGSGYRLASVRLTSQQEGGALLLPPLSRTEERAVRRQAKQVRRALQQVDKLFGYAGMLNAEEARALIQQRKQRMEEITDELAALGAGGPRAIQEGYAEAGTMRQKNLLIQALTKTQGTESSAVLSALYEQEPQSALRREVISGLGHRDDPVSSSALLDILGKEDRTLLRASTIQALAGRSVALDALAGVMGSLAESRDLRREAVRSVGLIRSEAARDALAGVARSPMDLAVRQSAIQELGRTYKQEALPALAMLLNDPQETIRHNAVKALGHHVGGDEVRALLAQVVLTDSSEAVRQRASYYLSKQDAALNTSRALD